MRLALAFTLVALTSPSLAFPASAGGRSAETAACPFTTNNRRQAVTFDPVKQKVDVTGDHTFQAPKPSDKRGPCPGLNALANHGYLSRDGITTLTEAIEATTKIYGMGVDLATFLSSYATIMTGDPLTQKWSIGESPGGLVLPPLLSAPQGLSGSHNKYEGDSSPGRGDAYLHNGDSSSLNLNNFKALYDLQPERQLADYNLGVLAAHRNQTFYFSIQNNPYFFYGPISGFIVAQAAHLLIPALMSNHSYESPDGLLTADVLKSFFSVSGGSSNLTYQKGHERIPENWYRREIGNGYGFAQAAIDALYVVSVVPETLSIGGNTGTVNSYAGVDIANLTGGVYNAASLLQGNNFACFAFQVVQSAVPDVLEGLLSDITSGLSIITNYITPLSDTLGCPQLAEYNNSLFGKYPGAGSGL